MAFIGKRSGAVVYMASSNITAVHAFTTRAGGVSQGIYSSLNLGEMVADDRENIRENYRRICTALGIPMEKLVFSHQVHRDDIRTAHFGDARELFSPIPYEADGLITDEAQLPLIIYMADCIPVLLHDPVRGAVGAVHCGWRGTVLGIAGKCVLEMRDKFGCEPKNIRAAIGPGIGLCCYETGQDVADAVYDLIPDEAQNYVFPKGGKYMVDLKGINRLMLEKAGVLSDNIDVSDECTMCLHEKYWSHRYTNGKRGLTAAIIMLKGTKA